MNKKTRIKRGTPFAWQDKRHLRIIRENYKGADRRNLLLLFLTITWMESDFADKNITYFRNSIKTYSGLSKKAISDGLKKLEKIEVLKITQLRNKGIFSGMEIEILDKNTETVKEHHGDFTEGHFTDVRKMTTIEEHTKKNILSKDNTETSSEKITRKETSSISELSEQEKEKNSAKKEKEYGRADLNKLDTWLQTQLNRTGWEDKYTDQRKRLKNIFDFKNKVGKEEFVARVKFIKKDQWKMDHRCGSLSSFFRILKSTPIQTTKPKVKLKDDEILDISSLANPNARHFFSTIYIPEIDGDLTVKKAKELEKKFKDVEFIEEARWERLEKFNDNK